MNMHLCLLRASFAQLVAFAVLGLCVSRDSVAQTHRVSDLRIDWGSWNFKPIYESTSGSAQVTGFLALAKEGSSSGDNLTAVWYVRSENQTWTKKSWLSTDAGGAIKHVKIVTGIPDTDDALWEVNRDLRVLPSDDPEPAIEYSMGLLANDPLQPLVSTSSDPAAIVSFLSDVGYKAADISIDHAAEFTTDEHLEVMASAIEAGLAINVIDDASARLQTETMAAIMASTTVIQPGTPTCVPRITGAWVLGAISPATACSWSVTDSWIAITGGRTYTCTYEWCCTYTRTRSAPAVRADCSIYTCTQIEIERVCAAPVVCTLFVPTPTPPAGWGAPCGTSPTCSTVPPVNPPAPAIWTWPNSTNCP
jgi:hypothetical protein